MKVKNFDDLKIPLRCYVIAEAALNHNGSVDTANI
tara:strand:- start:297 stop:401 length:105 start_codon:yes stop_codon:yes gene_type:complete